MAKAQKHKLHTNLVDVIDEVVQEKVDEKFDRAEDKIVGRVIEKLEKQELKADAAEKRISKDGQENQMFNPIAGP